MPDREVETIRDLIVYQYAKIIARRAFDAGERKFYDMIPPLLEKKYLKTIYRRHECANTLGGGDIDGDGEITVLDVDHILHGGTLPGENLALDGG